MSEIRKCENCGAEVGGFSGIDVLDDLKTAFQNGQKAERERITEIVRRVLNEWGSTVAQDQIIKEIAAPPTEGTIEPNPEVGK